jgi:S1-C subfamily serine protease
MVEKLKWSLVVIISMALGAALVLGIDHFDDDGRIPSTVSANTSGNGQTTVIERVSSPSSGGVSGSTTDTVADLYARVRASVVRINAANANSSTSGVGSGIVLDKQGHILTNNHVVNGFSSLDAVFVDGSSASAKVVGTDPGNDLAVIQVNVPADSLTPATLGDSDALRVGDFVMAVGNPFGLQGGASATEGIVSALGRSLDEGGRPLRKLIQSDAAINPGNSGGALFNGRGEVVGVTSAIENPSGERVFVGVGYAIPINTAVRFLPQMINGATIEHPRLGVSLVDVTPSVAQSLGLSVDKGVLIQSVTAGSAAEHAGLQGGLNRGGSGGDVIISIDGHATDNYEELADYIDSKQVGDTVKVQVVRDGKDMTFEVKLDPWTAT